MINYFKNWGNYLMDVLMLSICLVFFIIAGIFLCALGGDVDKAVTTFVKEVSKDL